MTQRQARILIALAAVIAAVIVFFAVWIIAIEVA